MKQLVEKHSTEEEKNQLELETKQRETIYPIKNQIENDIIGDNLLKIHLIYQLGIHWFHWCIRWIFNKVLDESLTKKEREIVDMNITMKENKKEIDNYKK